MKNINNKFNHKTKDISASFTGTKLTAFAGVVGLNKKLRKLKLFKKLNEIWPTQAFNATKYSNAQLGKLLILANLCGVKRLSNIETFSTDPLIMSTLNTKNKISDSRLAERIQELGERGSRALEKLGLQENREYLRTQEATTLTIDTDSTVSVTYGNQEGASVGYNPMHRGRKSYHPLLAFGSEHKIVLNTWFRPGNSYTANGMEEFTKQTLEFIPENIKKLFFRCDCGFFDNRFIQLLEDLRHEYLIKAKFKGMKQMLKYQDWQPIEGEPNLCSSEFDYIFSIVNQEGKKVKVGRTLRAIRLTKFLGVGKMGEQIVDYEYFCYCTNVIGKSIMEIHRLYGKRAECENWIEQVKNHLLAGKTLVDDFWSNDIFWQLSVLAYNISIKIRAKVKKIWQQEYNTFRDWFIRMPGQLVSKANKLEIRLYSQSIFKSQWESFYAVLNE